MEAGPSDGTVKEQGYTFVAKSVFKNAEDMEYYSEKCEAHQAYKVFLKENAPVGDLMSVYFSPGVSWQIGESS